MSKPGCLRFTAVTKSEATKRFRSIDIVREDTRENCRSLRSRVKGSRDSRSKGIANRNGEKYLRWSSDAFEEKRREVSLSLWIRHNTSATAVRWIRNRCPRGDYPRRRLDAYDVRDSVPDPERYRSGPASNPRDLVGLSLRACFEVVAYLAELAAGRVNNQGKRCDGANPIGKPAETNIEAGRLTEARV